MSGYDQLAHMDDLITGLTAVLPDLDDALIPSRVRRNDLLPITPEQAEAKAAVLRAEADEREHQQWHVLASRTRAGRVQPALTPPGPTTVPIVVAVSDARTVVTIGVLELDDAVSDRLGLTAARVSTTAQRLAHLRACLIAVYDDAMLTAHVISESTRMLNAARAAVEPAARIYVGRCPDCGQRSLQVDFDRDVIVCTNARCRCDVEDCRCHRGRRHTWGRPQWELLAARMGQDK